MKDGNDVQRETNCSITSVPVLRLLQKNIEEFHIKTNKHNRKYQQQMSIILNFFNVSVEQKFEPCPHISGWWVQQITPDFQGNGLEYTKLSR